MGDAWDDATTVVKDDKWDAEADDNVKDSWDLDDDDEVAVKKDEKKKETTNKAKATTKPVKAKEEAKPVKATEEASGGFVEIEGEGEWERKRRLEQLQKDRDLDAAMDLLGITEMRKAPLHPEAAIFATSGSVDAAAQKRSTALIDLSAVPSPVTVADMDAIAEQLVKGLQPLASHKHYLHLLEALSRGLLQSRDVTEVRRMASLMQDLVTVKNRERLERERSQAATAAAANSAKKPQATLGKKGGKFDMNDYGEVYDDDDY